MVAALAVTVGLLVQATPAVDPVRVWRADSTAYVTLREPGHLLLLHVDPIGRITVLFPFGPHDSTSIDGGVAFGVPLPSTAQGHPATIVAVRSRWAFDFAALQAEGWWNYHDALLLQPTAGDPVGALLDIADRVTDGRPYDYGGVRYSRNGTVAALGPPLPPQVCLSCVRPRTAVAVAAAPGPTNAVDCSNASLTNAFCGVNSGSVSITSAPPLPAYQPAPSYVPAPVYVPYYVPVFVHTARARFERPISPVAPARPQPAAAAAFPIAPRLVVPSRSALRTLTGQRP
jgi:hypothetical protein